MDNQFEGMNLRELVEALRDIKEKHAAEKAQASATWSIHEQLSKRLIPEAMEELGITTANFPGIGRIEIQHEASVSVPPENKMELYEWLRENGYGDLIIGTVNSSTMKAQVRKWIKDGEEFPIDLIKYSPYDNAVLVKAK